MIAGETTRRLNYYWPVAGVVVVLSKSVKTVLFHAITELVEPLHQLKTNQIPDRPLSVVRLQYVFTAYCEPKILPLFFFSVFFFIHIDIVFFTSKWWAVTYVFFFNSDHTFLNY